MNGLSAEAALIAASGLFDPEWYALQRPGVVPDAQPAAEHYLRDGAALGLDPGPGFSGARYLQAYPDVAAAGMNPLLHYLQYGRDEGRRRFPAGDGPSPLDEAIQALSGTALFDGEDYLDAYPDVRASGMDPLLHYLEHGAGEGRSPNPFFDTRHYQARHMAPGDDGNPLLHYLRAPDSAAAETSPLFDGRHYLACHPGAAASGMTPLEHFLVHGLALRRHGRPDAGGVGSLPRCIDGRRVRCTVVVPVHDAHDAVSACLRSLFANTGFGTADRLLVVDDASTDPRIGILLASLGDVPGVRVVRNPENLGYTRTVNLALALAGDDDVVLLNSDTVVGPNWLQRLKTTACRHDRIGTVTAVSNAAGEFSVPAAGNAPPPAGFDPDALARAVADSGAEPFEVPTGNGFCMYVRRALLASIGLFDEEAFPAGYGEENDFCMRAGAAGWTNLVDPSVYVQHVRSASFGDRRQALADAGFERVQRMHPGYTGAIRAIAASPRFVEARFRIARQFRRLAEGGYLPRPRILYVISTRVGGTPQTNADLMRAVAEHHDAIALCSDGQVLEVLQATASGYEVLERHALSEPLRFARHASLEYDTVVAGILRRWNVELVHIRHLAWHGLGLVEVARGLGLPVVFSFHDFYPVCPTVNLLDGQGRLHPRGVPEAAPNPLWHLDPTVSPMTPALLAAWQERMQQVLAGADAFVTTTAGARQLICDALPALAARLDDFHVIPHGRDFDRFGARPEPASSSGRPLRVLLAGNLSSHKGADLVRELKGLDAEGRFELHVLGLCPPALAPFVVEHGPYRREEFLERVERIGPDVAAVLSIWPETYCHILTECWASGLPVLGVDIGAVGERIRQHGGGWLVDYPATPEAVSAMLQRIVDMPGERLRRGQEVQAWQAGEGRARSTAWMAGRYLALYADVCAGYRLRMPGAS